ncbi:MAG: NAD(P)H-hydrate dehydratase [Leptospiraceae bacterium]|nr:NAD(P)H-hydrate dehydratase [Leptospiraceae bacterium]
MNGNKFLLTYEESRSLDQFTITEKKIPSSILMGMAGVSIFQEYREKFSGKKILCLCGSGNNGGDGLILSHLFFQAGFSVEVFVKKGNHSLAFQFYRKLLSRTFIPVSNIETFHPNYYIQENVLIIDALLGTGFQTPVKEDIAQYIRAINYLKKKNSLCQVLSLDTPSGYSPDSQVQVHPDYLAEIGSKKMETLFLRLEENQISFHPIGFSIEEFISLQKTNVRFFQFEKPKREELVSITKRKNDSHKYLNSAISFIGGSEGMSGAIYLAIKMFHRLGGGISKLFTHSTVTRNLILKEDPSFMVDIISSSSVHDKFLHKSEVVLIGPGLRIEELKISLSEMIRMDSFAILDAGAISLANEMELNEKIILTPHLGEFGALVGKKFQNQRDALNDLIKFSRTKNVNVLLKGSLNILALPNGEIYFAKTPNPILAVMGTGDLFAGALAFFLARTKDVTLATRYAIYLLYRTRKIEKKYPTSIEILNYIGEEL